MQVFKVFEQIAAVRVRYGFGHTGGPGGVEYPYRVGEGEGRERQPNPRWEGVDRVLPHNSLFFNLYLRIFVQIGNEYHLFHGWQQTAEFANGVAIVEGFAEGHFEIHFPKRFTRLLKFFAILPYRWYFPLIRRFTGG